MSTQSHSAPATTAPAEQTLPAEQTNAPTEPEKEQTLEELITSANLQYSLKNYDAAAEVYSKATERQAVERGEMDPANAELLFLYGRCLHRVAVANSDVLGGQVAGEAPKRGDQGSNRAADDSTRGSDGKAPFIAVSGVETDSDEEDEEGDDDPDQEDDFATAYEVLDLSRVLFEKKLEQLEGENPPIDAKGKGAAIDIAVAALTPELRHVKDRLADIHDLQAEISLENERFTDAVSDAQSALRLRLQIESPDSALIAEAYYKVALAQEFTFFLTVREAKEAQQQPNGSASAPAVEPQRLYDAIENLVKAIDCCELRVRNEETAIGSLAPQDAATKRLKITDVREIVMDMNTRVRIPISPTNMT
jgi:HAT1-interacting factor 1